MALIECPECKSQISSSAASCPRCGFAHPAGTGNLVFTRPGLASSAMGLEVYVDGKPYGRLRGLGGQLSVPVAPGDHHVELVTSQGRSGVGTIRAGSGDTAVTVKLSAMGTPKMS